MSDVRKPFPFAEFEPKWQSRWDDQKTFKTPNPGEKDFDATKPKYYVLDMFPYPSGAGLHVGHPEGYTATDIIGRYKRMNGFNVLHPMGYDSFGLPAEQYAIKTGQHPAITTAANIITFRRQLKALGFAYDWDREIATTDPEYVKWTQWIFLQLYNAYFCDEEQKAKPVSELEAKGWSADQIDDVRLAYVADTPVWWSPDLGTVLANEEVEEWKSKGHTVERRPLRQWMLRITKYAQRLIDELDTLDWPDGIKMLQKNWIGRSEGASVKFEITGHDQSVEVFTTRPDTLFGATYMVIAPEHPLVTEICDPALLSEIEKYRKECSAKSDLDRGDLNKNKTGIFIGAYAINPVNEKEVPIWIADYVMMGYGTGAIMAVPAHDERDFEFAEKFDLPITPVVAGNVGETPTLHVGNGIAVNSGFLDGMPTKKAKGAMIHWLVENGKGEKKIQFKLRDWLFSRQRYWGEPFPIIWRNGRHEALSESELPLLAPPLEDYKPSGTPDPLLNKATQWVEEPDGALRETNTMPQWAGSCWYYLRYCDPSNSARMVSKEAENYWTSEKPGMVDLYVGGAEHAVLHLLYARFWHKALYDLGHLSSAEPFQRYFSPGLILGEDGQKMSKSRGNVVSPDDVISEYGADSLRLYEMFMGPLEQVKPWQMKGVEGVFRFLARVWRLAIDDDGAISEKIKVKAGENRELNRVLHQTIKKVGEDIEKLSFNTAISQMMICTNTFMQAAEVPVASIVRLLQVLNPFAPHMTEEIYEVLVAKFDLEKAYLSEQKWPVYDEEALIETECELVVQVNGKLRERIRMAKDASEEDAKALAFASDKIQEFTEGKTLRKLIYIPGKIINLVVS